MVDLKKITAKDLINQLEDLIKLNNLNHTIEVRTWEGLFQKEDETGTYPTLSIMRAIDGKKVIVVV
jgi:hypothetical protein